MDKWVCKRCGAEIYEKPKKNAVCSCHGRYIHYTKCKCGKWYENKNNDKKFCSEECKGATLTLVCENCGEEFRRAASNTIGHKRHYCSIECLKKANEKKKVKRICEYCGDEFSVRISAIEKTNAVGRFCSYDCYWKSMRVDSDKCYAGFEKAKRENFSGVQFCAFCGTTKKIQIHHIVPNRLTHDQSKGNLIPLCPKHHIHIERITREFFDEEGFNETSIEALRFILRDRQKETNGIVREIIRRKRIGNNHTSDR